MHDKGPVFDSLHFQKNSFVFFVILQWQKKTTICSAKIFHRWGCSSISRWL